MPVISDNLVTAGFPAPQIICGTARIVETTFGRAVWNTGCYMGCVYERELCIPRYDDQEFVFDVVDQDGSPVDISTSTVVWVVANQPGGTILLTKSTADSSMSKSSATRVQWDITKVQSGALPVGRLYHEMNIVNSGGEDQQAMRGVFKVSHGFPVA